MSKTLYINEATEIINTILDEYNCINIEVVFDKKEGIYKLPDRHFKTYKFFKWKWKRKILKPSNWLPIRTSSLEDLVIAVEENMAKNFEPRIGKAKAIRERHATRLLNKEMEK